MKEPQYYELHKCSDCHLIQTIKGFAYNKNWEKKVLFIQHMLTTEQGFKHDVKGKCGGLIQKVILQNPDYNEYKPMRGE